MNNYNIIDATPEDAPLIAWAVMEAVGGEIVGNMAKGRTKDDVCKLFTNLAGREDSQYSYKNTRIALTPEGEKAGVCVSYNGSNLKRLRRSFFKEARKILRWEISEEEVDSLSGETCGEEFYLDSLAILPDYRGKGIAKQLIADAYEKAHKTGLPLGLLVADDNPTARKLYESQGFKAVGRRPFAGEMMTNMRKDKSIWESMVGGEIYNAAHPYLIKWLEEVRELLHEFNTLSPSKKPELKAILHRLLGAHGDNYQFNQPFRCDYGANIFIGENFFANFNLTVLDEAEVHIGDNCFIGPNVSIYTACHPIEPEPRNQLLEWAEPVTIGNNVWIGGSTTILPGVTIGDDVVIGAGSVVTKDIPARSVAVGNPARIIRHID